MTNISREIAPDIQEEILFLPLVEHGFSQLGDAGINHVRIARARRIHDSGIPSPLGSAGVSP